MKAAFDAAFFMPLIFFFNKFLFARFGNYLKPNADAIFKVNNYFLIRTKYQRSYKKASKGLLILDFLFVNFRYRSGCDHFVGGHLYQIKE